ncbi:sugar ABC transporter ATP-binding protein [Cryptosporangium aurantiacum]|uniref:Ribose transport system ATP-binding protein n=1 Tax=Cryptosporangium aurantiacum TaxID=134849 RepID=A0A1M7R694_9ACTN|nr:sugar ABC transporter ATP-binding protein [Cryptosporangium aurantiacum]SHN41875.1 ribose transport system ATP-binding protein [Cryptosporangium aurantiacum]
MLLATDLTKRYGGVTALAGAGLRLAPGEVHALLGENGAGKTTLAKILAGVVAPDTGRLTIDGADVRLTGPADARRHGIAVVSQELSLFGDLDVLGNLFVIDQPVRGGLLDRAEMTRRAAPILDELGLDDVPLRTPVGELDLARRQLLEICRALLADPGVVILDEPTSALPAAAVARLHTVIRRITARGKAVLYVSHFLEEVAALADRVTILRDGRNVVSEAPIAELSVPAMVTAMLGEAPLAAREAIGASAAGELGDRAVTLDRVTVPHRLDDVSLTARAGEVVGLAGLQGAGHLTVFEVLWGRAAPTSGDVRLPDGRPRPRTTAEAVRRRVAFVPSDRKGLGLTLDQTVTENITCVSWLARRRGGFVLRPGKARAAARRHIAELRIKAEPDDLVSQLSGGNQQKVAFAKWLEAEPDVVLLDDPTRGVDVGVKAEMQQIVRRLAADGKVVLMCSTDLAELAEVCDRVVVLHRGRVRDELAGEQLTEHRLMHAVNAGAAGSANVGGG